MKIQIRYENNRLDIFDTTAFTKAEPFDGDNMLTNFEVRVDALGNTGLWLMAHRYEVGDAYLKQSPDDETPTARRKRGWRFLLAEADELASIESVSIDGEVTLMRIEDELADMVRLDQMCALWLSNCAGLCIAQRAVLLFDALCRAHPEISADGETIARMCGFSARVMDELRDRSSPLVASEAEEEPEDWLQELTDGAKDYDI